MIAFFGRFHVLAVHLPIGVIVLAAAIEAAATRERWRGRADGVLGPILGVAVATSLLAYLLGTALALEGGRARDLVELHRWLALVTLGASAVGCAAWWLHRERGVSRWAHRGTLAAMLLALTGTAHVGGSITHGESYLVELAPAPVQRWLGRSEPGATPPPVEAGVEPTLFEAAVLPMLVERCGRCHGAKTAKGGLRVDGYDAIVNGGDGGPGIVVGHAASSALVARMEKPLDDDEHMPPRGRPQATADEIALLRFWIDRGASRELRLRDVAIPEGARTLIAAAVARAPSAARPSASPASSAAPSDPVAPAPATSASAAPSAGDAAEADPFAALVAESAAKTSAAQTARETPPTAAPTPAEPTRAPETTATPSTATASGPITWEVVAPILAAKCGACHGATKQKAKLRTDSIEALLRGGSSGPAVVRGNAKKGTLLERVHLAADDPMHMPPEEEPQLTTGEVRQLEQWIAAPPLAAKGAPTSTAKPEETSAAVGATPTAAPEPAAPVPSGSAPAPSASGSPAPSATASTAPPAPVAAPTPASEPAQSGGCAACRAAPGGDSPGGWLPAGVGLLAALQLRRLGRRRR